MTDAVHISNNTKDGGSSHAVGLGDLRVMILSEGENVWYAQGLEVDYLAQGTSQEEVKRAFEVGLQATISEHLKLFGNISKLLQIAPQEVWDEFYAHGPSGQYRFTQVSTHKLNVPATPGVSMATTVARKKPRKKVVPVVKPAALQPMLPFTQIQYLAECA